MTLQVYIIFVFFKRSLCKDTKDKICKVITNIRDRAKVFRVAEKGNTWF